MGHQNTLKKTRAAMKKRKAFKYLKSIATSPPTNFYILLGCEMIKKCNPYFSIGLPLHNCNLSIIFKSGSIKQHKPCPQWNFLRFGLWIYLCAHTITLPPAFWDLTDTPSHCPSLISSKDGGASSVSDSSPQSSSAASVCEIQ